MRARKNDSFLLIVAIAGIAGSVFVGALLPGVVQVLIEDRTDQDAYAANYPLVIEHDDKYKLRELSGDARTKRSSLEVFESNVVDPDQSCEFCTLLRYTPGGQQYGGVAYTGDKPIDLSKAKRLTLFAMGEDGGEKIKIGVAGKKVKANGEVKYALRSKPITLTNDWTPIEIDLSKLAKKHLVDVTYPFGIDVLKSNDKTSSVYLKYVTFDLDIAENPTEMISDISGDTQPQNQ